MTEKKNPDYSATAVDLKNDVRVAVSLAFLQEAKQRLEELEGEAQRCVPETLQSNIRRQRTAVDDALDDVKHCIGESGSYQDIEAGHYAVKQMRVTPVYHVGPFKEHYAPYVPAVIVETINKAALQGLIKGKLIEEADLKMYKVITQDITYAFIIK